MHVYQGYGKGTHVSVKNVGSAFNLKNTLFQVINHKAM